MAGDWIKMRCNLDTDPAVFQMAAALQMDELAVVGRLWKVWAWADQHIADCNAVSVTTNVLDRITTTPGFAEAMRKVGWLEGREGALSFPHFDRHNGQTAKKRALTKNRVEKTRGDSVTLPALQERYQRREEKSIDSPPRAREEAWEEPSREQIAAAAGRVGLTAEQADIWRSDHLARPIAADGRWTDRNGKPIGNWQHALAAWAGRWKQNERDKEARSAANHNGHNGSPKPAEGVWHLEKRIEAAQKEIDRIQANPANKEQVPDSFDRRLKTEPMAKVKALKASISIMRQRMAGVEVAA
jgi:hypothetical protein